MDVQRIKECLNKAGRQELGIPIVLQSFAESLFPLTQWALEGTPVEGRQVWFVVGNAEDIRNQLPSELRGRILPLSPSQNDAVFKRGPYDSLLLPPSDPNLSLSAFWKQRGSYELCKDIQAEEFQLWFWKSNRKPLRLFGLDHHHAVLWDAKQILRPLGVKLDFVWLCDGRPPINEAIPCEIPSFQSSIDIYRPPVDKPLSPEASQYILDKGYDGIITSHSIVTCHRLKDIGLPMIHINSTRFGNDWIQSKEKHDALVHSIKELFQQKRLTVLHNNEGDAQYFHQYFPSLSPNQDIIVPSLSESALRLRVKAPEKTKILIWDTRQVLLQQDGSPFMKHLYTKLKQRHGDAIDSQAVLMAEAKNYLPEGYLDRYTAVIHIPYNVSTMSMFQQVRANIPIWIPTKRLLAELWKDTKEPNELSWSVFAPGSEVNASTMDQVRNPDVIRRWLDTADFYNPDVLPLIFQFDSAEELVEKVMTVDYQAQMNKAEETQQRRREDIFFAWEQVLQHL
jgi:hypothetical protein